LLVDRVTKISKQGIEGYKNVSFGDIAFLGHFPEVSIMPGVLIVESLAQLSGLLLSSQGDGPDGPGSPEGPEGSATSEADLKIGFLTSIRKFNFIKSVEPGDQLFLKSILKGNSGECFVFAVSAFVDRAEVASGEIQLFLQRKDLIV
jgi:3-hydroxyacyl-[acyl-carrier-protein] dehydratase